MNESNKSGDSSLHDWFTKSRASDGTPGWVQLGGKYAGKPCAKQPGQTTKPKCGSSKMKRNLDKGEEESAFRRKNREDPNPNRKGKAKNVATEEMNLDEKCWQGYTQKGMKKKGNKVVPNCVPVGEEKKDHEYSMARSEISTLQNAAKRLKKKMGKKGEGNLEAWVQSKITKAADYLDTAADYVTNEEVNINEIHASAHTPHEVPSKNLKRLVSKAVKRVDTDADGDVDNNDKAKGELGEFIPGVGNKRLYSGTMTKTAQSTRIKSVKEALEEQNRVQTTGQAGDPQTVTYPDGRKQTFRSGTVIRDIDTKPKPKPKPSLIQRVGESFAIDPAAHRKQQRIEKANKLQQGSTGAESQAAGAAVKRLGGSGISLPLANSYQPEGDEIEEGLDKRFDSMRKRGGRSAPEGERSIGGEANRRNKDYWADEGGKDRDRGAGNKAKRRAAALNTEEVAAWQRKAGKNKEGGLNEKGRKSYERENPGSDLKAPSKKVGNPRRKSFCARMSGMKKKLTSSKTANDPNSRINKSLRAWNC
jgi:hypothetical protein